ncbi:hypothetical protein SPRG_02243 [Saprolegnia parasitica CBS 223.65]|uniref:Uncharacterized protein n=1 Tax=Saprolegnia parasitica (strain CBS 223.65) TaxID=695850 RepID=A0A067D3V6_SAPPC|nr:hypothetical protein SPRG_02243 [Saprolegnia parasitica CBS 223.65]KDO33436.1 hypothetical protein SPRG_02243 [Saprolegnia parasitica CBS 223.65]|eukprot:XP_012196182.1 hypothetical protein SPRG_02243 [Saprolegnia parasitica CBS 223.65]
MGGDMDADIKLPWSRVCLAVISYGLFFTDIPRSGLGFPTLPSGFRSITESHYSSFGPYAYPILGVTKTNNGAYIGSRPFAKVWSYKFDTCSVGLRTVVASLDVAGWDPCLVYQADCNTTQLSPESVFRMLDNVVSAVVAAPSLTWRVIYYYYDIINDLFAFGTFQERDWRTVRTHYVPSPDVDVCDPTSPTRPFFCEQLWTDFGALGDVSTGRIPDDIRSRFQAQVNASDALRQRVELVLLEAIDDIRPWGGGFTKSYTSAYDVVALLRVQNCSSSSLDCETVFVSDYRYEGGFAKTNTMRYYGVTHILRLFGQTYNICRALTLFLGCYLARAAEPKYADASLLRRLLCATRTFLRIPAQVVIHGSWLPVAAFVVAHLIDSPLLYYCIFMQLGPLNGATRFTPDQIYSFWVLLTCHMRNVWVLSLATKCILLAVDQRRRQTILGFRGYLLPCVSFLSIFFELRLTSLRRTDLLSVVDAVPSVPLTLLRELHTIPSNYRYWGAFSDIKNLFLSWSAVYIVFGGLFRRRLGFRTTVPFTLLRYCNRSMFSTSWNALAPESTAVTPLGDLSSTRHSLNALMHITWMTDPLQYMMLRWNQPVVYVYRRKATGTRLYHPLSPRELARQDAALSESVDVMGQVFLMELPWADRIYCY